jgi:peptide subunit release factor 1 (eRF1)
MKEITIMEINRLMDELAVLEPSEFPFISLYLNAQADHHGRDNFEPFVRKELSNHAKAFAEESPQRKSFDRDAERINEYLARELPSSADGVAIFASAGADDFFEAVHFQAPIAANEMHVSGRPNLFPLARVVDQNPRYAALVADTDAARILVVDMGRVTHRVDIDNTGRNLAPAGVWSQLRFERRAETFNSLHAKEVVDALDRVVREEGIENVVLFGDDVIIPLLRRHLPLRLADVVTDVLSLDIRTPEHEILKTAMHSILEDNTQSDAEKVRELLDRHRAGGPAVAGLQETLDALLKGSVNELVLSATPDEIRMEKTDAGMFPAEQAASVDPDEGSAEAAGVLITHAVRTRAAITFIEDPMLLSEIGGVGAFLRYQG